MQRRSEVMQLMDDRLFDGEWYERTELLRGSHPGNSGYYVVVWNSDAMRSEREAGPRLLGPFPSADAAWRRARELR
jgi:hypothetical protein